MQLLQPMDMQLLQLIVLALSELVPALSWFFWIGLLRESLEFFIVVFFRSLAI